MFRHLKIALLVLIVCCCHLAYVAAAMKHWKQRAHAAAANRMSRAPDVSCGVLEVWERRKIG